MTQKIDDIGERISRFLKIGNVSSKLLMHLVEDILDLGKFEAGTFSLNNSEFTVHEIIEDLSFIFEVQCKEKGLHFITEADESLMHKTFVSDNGRIKQVLINLLSNSLKFTQKGMIQMKVEEVKSISNRQLRFTVYDTGVGIPKKDQDKLFKMFSMLDHYKNKYNQRGTGLGLAISHKIVESLNGTITVESEENKYTKFVFTIDLDNTAPVKSEPTSLTYNLQEDFSNSIKFHSKAKKNSLSKLITFKHREKKEEKCLFSPSHVNLNFKDGCEEKEKSFEKQISRHFQVNSL
jgi:signal transduction histidine kinase